MTDNQLATLLLRWDRNMSEALAADWSEAVHLAIDAAAASDATPPLDRDASWVLLSWCEDEAAAAVRTRDLTRLDTCASALLVLARQDVLDTREVWVVGSLVRRAADIIGVGWAQFRKRHANDSEVLRLLDCFPPVSPLIHRESGSGASFAFERLPALGLSDDEVIQRLRANAPGA